jgi:hypothetical protein
MRTLCPWLLGVLLALPVQARENPELELLQINACRTVSSFLSLRGEGPQSELQARLEHDRALLQAGFDGLGTAWREPLGAPYAELLARLDEGLGYGPAEDDLPWRYPGELSRALVDLLKVAEQLDEGDADPLLMSALQLELLNTEYAALAYLGYFEATRDADRFNPSKSEQQLLRELDDGMAAALPLLGQTGADQGRRAQADWRYLRMALSDFDSNGRARLGRSGKPLAPLMVGRHARGMSERLLQLARLP